MGDSQKTKKQIDFEELIPKNKNSEDLKTHSNASQWILIFGMGFHFY